MKKLAFVFTVVAIVMSFGIIAGAETFKDNNWGVSFEIPEGFEVLYSETGNTEGYLGYVTEDGRACINLSYAKDDNAYFAGRITDEEFGVILDAECATEYLASQMTEGVVNFKSKNTYDKVIGETKHYFFEGKYVLNGESFEAEEFSVTAVTWAKNGRIYIVSYIRFANGKDIDVESFLSNIDYSSGEIKIYVNDSRVHSDTPPAAMAGRTLVPIRAVAEAMGYTVMWDGENQLVTLVPENEDDNTVEFVINSSTYTVNDEKLELDVAALAVNGRTYIPLRAAAEAMGAMVSWDSSSNSAMIVQ